ncbi:MAG: hypothetical protein IM550_16965 [Microcystis sp. M54BS1]|uniref:hypothetical protein n=1 Tax=Microcystis TaxID=1125 RepID=UPI000A89B3C2|nr:MULTISPECIES: hypothetical protein [Microcystis]MCA2507884.1 hypothetical protein [Microcystis sp. M62BS1]MCA2540838.1 hypothetical protein [Microcystis sp. M54BS1]MCA2548910.1 hypothetical protein [Microcystis sp. M53BS1]MCA2569013.1 hypothetical protein [Microcystis sp. M44BS1]MCA2596689.1 hypothetical protein [Microcystis sp. M38BS1]MCA2608721.1 hypothetical protein [Microcystis sp. M27BS1]
MNEEPITRVTCEQWAKLKGKTDWEKVKGTCVGIISQSIGGRKLCAPTVTDFVHNVGANAVRPYIIKAQVPNPPISNWIWGFYRGLY